MRRVVAGIDVGGTFTDLLLAETGADGRYSDATIRSTENGELLVIDLMLKDDPFTESGQDAVKDLRSEHEVNNPSSVFDGDLDGFLAAGIRWRKRDPED